MASGRTISANFLTDLDGKVIDLCAQISDAASNAIPDADGRTDFKRVYGKISKTSDGGAGLGGGKLQRDALCTRGRGGKAPYSNRNLRWHPLVVAETKPSYANEIERIEIEGDAGEHTQTLIFVIKDEFGNTREYPSDRVFELPSRFVALPKHWYPHIERLKLWSDILWTQNSCVIPALESCNWQDSVETYAVLATSIASEFYGADFNALYNEVTALIRAQTIDENLPLPSSNFPTSSDDFLQCPLCRINISSGLDRFRQSPSAATWQPGWRTSKKSEGDDSSIQIMHVNPLVESSIRHNAANVRYGHRWCNVAMSDHSLDETLDFMEYIVRANERIA